jgi:hypothetical protein
MFLTASKKHKGGKTVRTDTLLRGNADAAAFKKERLVGGIGQKQLVASMDDLAALQKTPPQGMQRAVDESHVEDVIGSMEKLCSRDVENLEVAVDCKEYIRQGGFTMEALVDRNNKEAMTLATVLKLSNTALPRFVVSGQHRAIAVIRKWKAEGKPSRSDIWGADVSVKLVLYDSSVVAEEAFLVKLSLVENIKADVQKKISFFDVCVQLREYFVSHCKKVGQPWEQGMAAVPTKTRVLVLDTLGDAGSRSDIARVAGVPEVLWGLVKQIFDPKQAKDAKGKPRKPPSSGSHMAGLANLPTKVAKVFLTSWAKGEIKGKDFLQKNKLYKRQMLVRKMVIMFIAVKEFLTEEEFEKLEFGKEAEKGDAVAIAWSWEKLKELYAPLIDNYKLMRFATYEMCGTEHMGKVISLGTTFQDCVERMMTERSQAAQAVCFNCNLRFFCCPNVSLILMNSFSPSGLERLFVCLSRSHRQADPRSGAEHVWARRASGTTEESQIHSW